MDLATFTLADWPESQLVATVLESDGRPLAGLTGQHFQVLVNDRLVDVVSVTQGVDSSLGIAVVVVLDVSGSMAGGLLGQAKAASNTFLQGLAEQDRIAVVSFSDTVTTVVQFTQDVAAASKAIDGLAPLGDTALYDATVESIRLAVESGSGRMAIVLLTDGVDKGSSLARDEALSAARTQGVPIFTIGLGNNLDRDYLRELAEVSGGRFAETPSPEGLAQLYAQVGELLRGQYVLTLDATTSGLVQPGAARVRLDVTAGGRAGSGERTFAPNGTVITLTEVEDGEHLEASRTIIAEVITAEEITSVTFLVDGQAVDVATEPPYEFTFDPASVAEGEHTLTVRAASATGGVASASTTVRTSFVPAGDGHSAGASGGGGLGTGAILAIAFIALAAAGLLFAWRRYRNDGLASPSPAAGVDPSGGLVSLGGPRPDGSGRLWTGETHAPPPSPSGEPLGRLLVVSGSLQGESFSVSDTPASIGSGHRCLISLPQVSGGEDIAPEHARFWVRDGQLLIHELRRLTPTGGISGGWLFLGPGEEFTVGECTFVFELDASEAEPEKTSNGSAPAEPQETPNVLRDASTLRAKRVEESGEGKADDVAPEMAREDAANAEPPSSAEADQEGAAQES